MQAKSLILLIALSIAIPLAACTSGPQPLVQYKSAVTRPPLEIPPGLDQLPAGGSESSINTLSGFKAEQNTIGGMGGGVLPQFPNVQLKHADGQYWLLVHEKPDQVWANVRNFIFNLGLTVSYQNKATGVLETDWAENRAKLDRGFVTRIFRPFDSTGTRDRYLFQLIRGNQRGTTEVHVVHQGLKQVVAAADTEGAYQYIWEPAPPDYTIEAEVLRLLMVSLGVNDAASRAAIAASDLAQPRAVLGVGNDRVPQILLREPVADAWTRVGQVLARTATLKVEDQDPGKRVYSIRVSKPADNKKPGFFGHLFGEKAGPEKYRVVLASDGARTVLRLQTPDAKPDKSDAGKALLKLLYKQLR